MRRSLCNRLPAAPSRIPPQAIVPDLIKTAAAPLRAALKGNAATAQMADDMRQAGHREGGVTDRDLELLGWTAGQVKEIAPQANIRAQQLAGAMV